MACCGAKALESTLSTIYIFRRQDHFVSWLIMAFTQFLLAFGYNLGQNKWKTLTSPSPPNQRWENGAFLPFARLHPRFGGGGGAGRWGFAVPFYFVQDCRWKMKVWYLPQGIVCVVLGRAGDSGKSDQRSSWEKVRRTSLFRFTFLRIISFLLERKTYVRSRKYGKANSSDM